MTRAGAFEKLDRAARDLEATRFRCKTVHEEARELRRRAEEMQETSTQMFDRALLEYATARAELTNLLELDSWNEYRASDLLKKSEPKR